MKIEYLDVKLTLNQHEYADLLNALEVARVALVPYYKGNGQYEPAFGNTAAHTAAMMQVINSILS